MRISEYRCLGSLLVEQRRGVWYSDSSLVRSQRRVGFFWGSCVFCGRRHYDRVDPDLSLRLIDNK